MPVPLGDLMRANARIAALEAENAWLKSHVILLAESVLNYPEFDCDNQTEPRPLCRLARNAIDAAMKEKQ